MLKGIFVSLIICLAVFFTGHIVSKTHNDLPIHVFQSQLNHSAQSEIRCLADNIYYESAYEPKKGQIAVAFVTLNRVKSGYFPSTICEVVKQRTRETCQFTWYCEDKNLTKINQRVYDDILKLSIHVYANHDKMKDPSKGALFYHADYVNPKWKNMIRTAVIGRHIFYNRRNLT